MKLIIGMGIMLLALMFGVNGDLILSEEQFGNLSNQQIQNYMTNQFVYTHYDIDTSAIYIYYSIAVIEPTHVNDTYRVFNVDYRTDVTLSNINLCLNNYNLNVCYNNLVMGDAVIEFVNDDNETISIQPSYYQAYNRAIQSYQSAIALRDNLANKLIMQNFMNEG